MEEIEKMKEKLFFKRENGNLKLSDELLEKAKDYCEDYKKFLNLCKTERRTCEYSEILAKEKGFEIFSKDKTYKPGDKAYFINRNKNVVLIESQAPWMPLIPKHWKSDKFKFHLQVDEHKGFPDLEVLSLYL